MKVLARIDLPLQPEAWQTETMVAGHRVEIGSMAYAVLMLAMIDSGAKPTDLEERKVPTREAESYRRSVEKFATEKIRRFLNDLNGVVKIHFCYEPPSARFIRGRLIAEAVYPLPLAVPTYVDTLITEKK